jgi:protein TonB
MELRTTVILSGIFHLTFLMILCTSSSRVTADRSITIDLRSLELPVQEPRDNNPQSPSIAAKRQQEQVPRTEQSQNSIKPPPQIMPSTLPSPLLNQPATPERVRNPKEIPLLPNASGIHPSPFTPSEKKTTNLAGTGADTTKNVATEYNLGDKSTVPGNKGSSVSDSVRASYLSEHFVYIRELITGRLEYPPLARKMGWRGQVNLAFTVLEDGSVRDVRVVNSSGYALLDHNAVETVQRAAPFPKPPIKAELLMPVRYVLQ